MSCSADVPFTFVKLTNKVNDKLLEIHVECYSGYMAEETPRRLLLGRRRVEVMEVLDRWLAPDHRYFKIEGDDGGVYILRHDVAAHRWKLMPTPPRPAGAMGAGRMNDEGRAGSVRS